MLRAARHERSEGRQNTRAGGQGSAPQARACKVWMKVPKVPRLTCMANLLNLNPTPRWRNFCF